jgi:Protein of unknown function with PCYCGC motif
MRLMHKVMGTLAILGAGLVLKAAPRHVAPRLAPQAEEAVPAFHAQAPKAELPATMSPKLFTDIMTQNSYAVAARIRKTLYQQPCYCHCDRSQGHGSLLDCFVSRHASGCDICMREGLYTYELVKKGKTAAQIRDAIIKGDWKTLDATKYQRPLPAK